MLPLSNKYTELIDNDVGEDEMFNRDCVNQVKRGTYSLFEDMCSKIGVKNPSDLRACYMNKPQITKSMLLEWLETTVFLLYSCSVPLLEFATTRTDELDDLKTEKINDQKKIIELQDQLIEKKTDELCTVQQTVKSELQSYSSVLQKNCSDALEPRKIAAAVKQVEKKEDRSCNIVAFGVPESEEIEGTESKVLNILEHLEEKPKIVSCCRIGQQKSGTVRPIRLRFQNSVTAYQILNKAKKLKDIDAYKSVYLSPDRSPEERDTRRKLVEELKRKRLSDPNSSYHIRRGKVVCISEG